MRILIDTNVLISAFIFDGKPLFLLKLLSSGNDKIYVSEYIEHEFHEKIKQKWPLKSDDIFHAYRKAEIEVLKSTSKIYRVLRDSADDPILSDAIYHKIDILVSGDRDFLEAGLTTPRVMSVSMVYDMIFDHTVSGTGLIPG